MDAEPSPESLAALERVRDLLTRHPLIDGHNDLPWVIRAWREEHGADATYDLRRTTPGRTDIPRLREGRVGAQFWAVFTPFESVTRGAVKTTLEQFDVARDIVESYPDVFEAACTADDVERIFGEGRIASLLGVEGGHGIENSLAVLRAFRELGAAYMTLTHEKTTDWADSATDEERHGGLSDFGVDVIREMNRLGMMVDLSHASVSAMHDALDASSAPVIWSHSSAKALVDHPRNVPDEVLARVPGNRGLVMVTFVPAFVSVWHDWWDEKETAHRLKLTGEHPDDPATVEAALDAWRQENYMPPATHPDVADHIEHVRDVAGIEHVGIGSDFDGFTRRVEGLEDVSDYPRLFQELALRGWSDEELALLAGGNLLRVMRETESVSERRPSPFR